MVYSDQYGRLYSEEELNKMPMVVFENKDFHVVNLG